MKQVCSTQQMRNYDRFLIESKNIPGIKLMENAASGVLAYILENTVHENVLIVCGKGNNGGDGLALLLLLNRNGINASAVLLADDSDISGDAAYYLSLVRKNKLNCVNATDDEGVINSIMDNRYDLAVDAIFGTGLCRDVTGHFKTAIDCINSLGASKLSVDIPSGINGDDGQICGTCVNADATVTFVAYKRGLLLFPGRNFCGTTVVHSICDDHPEPDSSMDSFLMQEVDVKKLLPPRSLDSHKGKNGKALVIAGSFKYRGAAALCTKAALRGGCGLLRLICPEAVVSHISQIPEVMLSSDFDDYDSIDFSVLAEALNLSDCIAIGPGMGNSNGVSDVTETVLNTKKRCIVDADALNAISLHETLLECLHSNVILTPHYGEMARLTKTTVHEIAKDPCGAAMELSRKTGTVVLLKGATTIICDGNKTCFSTFGNPGLAKGGSGDVLCGIILAMLSQGLKPFEAAIAGAYILGHSADEAMQILSNRMLIASDVIDAISLM